MKAQCLLVLLAALTFQGGLLPAAADDEVTNEALFFLYQQYWVANPVSGANFPPPETPQSDRFQGIANLTIPSQLWVEHIIIHEDTHSFEARYWWAMNYEDSRTADLISETNSSDNCAQLCSTHARLVLNKYGDNACCTAVYMPNSFYQNIIGGSLQNQPNEWLVFAIPDSNRVQYWARGTSTFSSTFRYGAFPFDRQTLQFRILNEFLPEVDGDEGIQLMSPSAVIPALASFRQDSNAFRDFSIKGWKVVSKSATVTAFREKSPFAVSRSNDTQLTTGQEKLQPGCIFSIDIERTTTGFWIQILILPTVLLILFSFLSFFVPGNDIKTRMEILSGMFLAILLLQYTVRGYLPGNQAIMPPYIVLVVSYIYLLGIALVFLLIFTLENLYKMNTVKIKVLQAEKRRIAFQKSQLKQLLREKTVAKKMMHMPSKAVDEEVSQEICDTNKKVDAIDRSIEALRRPWHEARAEHACSKLFQTLLTQRLTSSVARWFSCLGMDQAEDYCRSLAHSVEKVLVTGMTATYLLVTVLVYYISYRNSPWRY